MALAKKIKYREAQSRYLCHPRSYCNRLRSIFLQRRSKAKISGGNLLHYSTQNLASLGKNGPIVKRWKNFQKVMFSFLCHMEEV
jgi:hypothetical protein